MLTLKVQPRKGHSQLIDADPQGVAAAMCKRTQGRLLAQTSATLGHAYQPHFLVAVAAESCKLTSSLSDTHYRQDICFPGSICCQTSSIGALAVCQAGDMPDIYKWLKHLASARVCQHTTPAQQVHRQGLYCKPSQGPSCVLAPSQSAGHHSLTAP